MPDAVQGASSRMPSNSWPSHQAVGCSASPTTTRAARPMRCRVWWMRSQRCGVHVQRGHVGIDEFQQVRGLAAGRGAGVQHRIRPLAGCRPFKQQGRGLLGGGVLHRHQCPQQSPAVRAPGVPGPAPGHAGRRMGWLYAGFASVSAVLGWSGLARIDAQRHGRGQLLARRMSCQRCGMVGPQRSIHQRGWFQRATGSRWSRRPARRVRAESGAGRR
jgi:hypothetical protein